MDIGKGDWVVCIDDKSPCLRERTIPFLKEGNTYYVEGIVPSRMCMYCKGASTEIFRLLGQPVGLPRGFCPLRFRPLRKPPEETSQTEEKVPEYDVA